MIAFKLRTTITFTLMYLMAYVNLGVQLEIHFRKVKCVCVCVLM